MGRRIDNAGGRRAAGSTLIACIGLSIGMWCGACGPACGQAVPVPATSTPATSPPPLGATPMPSQTGAPKPGQASSQGKVNDSAAVVDEHVKPASGVLVDQVIAVVNGDLVLESDVDEEERFEAFQPFSAARGKFDRDKAIERLVDRALILQQSKIQPGEGVNTEEAKTQLLTLRKDIPACKQYHCETDAGWARFVHDQGFTVDELTERWRQRMEILQFIEMRFRMGIHILPAEIKAYYDKTLLPEYAQQHATAPPLETISDRIEEILLQQRVSTLLQDWLESLKAQGNVRMMKPTEVER